MSQIISQNRSKSSKPGIIKQADPRITLFGKHRERIQRLIRCKFVFSDLVYIPATSDKQKTLDRIFFKVKVDDKSVKGEDAEEMAFIAVDFIESILPALSKAFFQFLLRMSNSNDPYQAMTALFIANEIDKNHTSSIGNAEGSKVCLGILAQLMEKYRGKKQEEVEYFYFYPNMQGDSTGDLSAVSNELKQLEAQCQQNQQQMQQLQQIPRPPQKQANDQFIEYLVQNKMVDLPQPNASGSIPRLKSSNNRPLLPMKDPRYIALQTMANPANVDEEEIKVVMESQFGMQVEKNKREDLSLSQSSNKAMKIYQNNRSLKVIRGNDRIKVFCCQSFYNLDQELLVDNKNKKVKFETKSKLLMSSDEPDEFKNNMKSFYNKTDYLTKFYFLFKKGFFKKSEGEYRVYPAVNVESWTLYQQPFQSITSNKKPILPTSGILYQGDCNSLVDMPYIFFDGKLILLFGIDFRAAESMKTKAQNSTQVVRMMMACNLLNNYPLYNSIDYFIELYAIASDMTVAEAFEKFSSHDAPLDPVGALVFNTGFQQTKLVLIEEMYLNENNVDFIRIPNLKDLILLHQYQSGFGEHTYVIEVHFEDGPHYFVVECWQNYFTVKGFSGYIGGKHQIVDRQDIEEIAENKIEEKEKAALLKINPITEKKMKAFSIQASELSQYYLENFIDQLFPHQSKSKSSKSEDATLYRLYRVELCSSEMEELNHDIIKHMLWMNKKVMLFKERDTYKKASVVLEDYFQDVLRYDRKQKNISSFLADYGRQYLNHEKKLKHRRNSAMNAFAERLVDQLKMQIYELQEKIELYKEQLSDNRFYIYQTRELVECLRVKHILILSRAQKFLLFLMQHLNMDLQMEDQVNIPLRGLKHQQYTQLIDQHVRTLVERGIGGKGDNKQQSYQDNVNRKTTSPPKCIYNPFQKISTQDQSMIEHQKKANKEYKALITKVIKILNIKDYYYNLVVRNQEIICQMPSRDQKNDVVPHYFSLCQDLNDLSTLKGLYKLYGNKDQKWLPQMDQFKLASHQALLDKYRCFRSLLTVYGLDENLQIALNNEIRKMKTTIGKTLADTDMRQVVQHAVRLITKRILDIGATNDVLQGKIASEAQLHKAGEDKETFINNCAIHLRDMVIEVFSSKEHFDVMSPQKIQAAITHDAGTFAMDATKFFYKGAFNSYVERTFADLDLKRYLQKERNLKESIDQLKTLLSPSDMNQIFEDDNGESTAFKNMAKLCNLKQELHEVRQIIAGMNSKANMFTLITKLLQDRFNVVDVENKSKEKKPSKSKKMQSQTQQQIRIPYHVTPQIKDDSSAYRYSRKEYSVPKPQSIPPQNTLIKERQSSSMSGNNGANQPKKNKSVKLHEPSELRNLDNHNSMSENQSKFDMFQGDARPDASRKTSKDKDYTSGDSSSDENNKNDENESCDEQDLQKSQDYINEQDDFDDPPKGQNDDKNVDMVPVDEQPNKPKSDKTMRSKSENSQQSQESSNQDKDEPMPLVQNEVLNDDDKEEDGNGAFNTQEKVEPEPAQDVKKEEFTQGKGKVGIIQKVLLGSIANINKRHRERQSQKREEEEEDEEGNQGLTQTTFEKEQKNLISPNSKQIKKSKESTIPNKQGYLQQKKGYYKEKEDDDYDVQEDLNRGKRNKRVVSLPNVLSSGGGGASRSRGKAGAKKEVLIKTNLASLTLKKISKKANVEANQGGQPAHIPNIIGNENQL